MAPIANAARLIYRVMSANRSRKGSRVCANPLLKTLDVLVANITMGIQDSVPASTEEYCRVIENSNPGALAMNDEVKEAIYLWRMWPDPEARCDTNQNCIWNYHGL
jgi:hypothetical protein